MSRFSMTSVGFSEIDDEADLSNLIEPILALLGVLLIFVVIALMVPTLTTIVSELAEVSGDDLTRGAEKAVVVSLSGDGTIHIDSEGVSMDQLDPAIAKLKAEHGLNAIYLVGDAAAPYGVSVQIKGVMKTHQIKIKEVGKKKGH